MGKVAFQSIIYLLQGLLLFRLSRLIFLQICFNEFKHLVHLNNIQCAERFNDPLSGVCLSNHNKLLLVISMYGKTMVRGSK